MIDRISQMKANVGRIEEMMNEQTQLQRGLRLMSYGKKSGLKPKSGVLNFDDIWKYLTDDERDVAKRLGDLADFYRDKEKLLETRDAAGAKTDSRIEIIEQKFAKGSDKIRERISRLRAYDGETERALKSAGKDILTKAKPVLKYTRELNAKKIPSAEGKLRRTLDRSLAVVSKTAERSLKNAHRLDGIGKRDFAKEVKGVVGTFDKAVRAEVRAGDAGLKTFERGTNEVLYD